MTNCIFCSIVKGERQADIVASKEECVAFKDIQPKAPFHILVVPRKHVASVAEMEDGDAPLIGQLIRCAKVIAEESGIDKTGYKLVFNVGRGGGQIIDHIHLHLLGGWNNNEPPANI
ncbi:MAG: histidine triad nucleotide-binding protein [Candidatus Terrybacteria bacterium RIFCSPLOWO2_01_FULL_44_24]|uniref:Histidine triad nucleotide-binding protein n=1 Tax=Candidatus Terrybacteria bacterium RIFCSPHIGHO2_01_FULL_43_35 TaxID=1802361 RepID=A0A1G2PE41_9BACT|nr:MAG: histidine triad nucleotide-binding protein [Candidatus Terrybacteria bacterium RIFCSPHIGHO2_01_FULL_43_35]OHA50814.1 MAG: histidine triad nucleotide-binding protein [Candidatus Terrybacteria bacterium RIFCSPLOWO2_01_FULL_44_24]